MIEAKVLWLTLRALLIRHDASPVAQQKVEALEGGLHARQEHGSYLRDVYLVLVGSGFSKVVQHVRQARAEALDKRPTGDPVIVLDSSFFWTYT